MTWSYQDTMPRSIDKVRFYVGDTNPSDQLLSDEEITFALSEASGNVRRAASLCATRKAAEWSRLSDLKEGQLSISYSQRSKQMLTIAEAIQESSAIVDPAIPSAGAIFVADKIATEEDTTLVMPSFGVDMLDNDDVGRLSRNTTSQREELE